MLWIALLLLLLRAVVGVAVALSIGVLQINAAWLRGRHGAGYARL